MANEIINSFPAFHLTGAIQCFVRTPASIAASSNDTYFLGTCEVQPDVRITQLRAEVKNSNFGIALPGQKTRQGQKADIVLPLSYFSYSALNALLTPSGSSTSAGDTINTLQVKRGWEGRFSRGALTDGVDTFELWLVFERQTNANVRNSTMPIGWFFPQVEMLVHNPVKCGPQEVVMMLVLEARPKRIAQVSHTAVGTNERTHQLYVDPLPGDSDVSTYFPASVLVPQ